MDPSHTPRSITIDVLRGISVFGMIIAHAIFFFHDQSNFILQSTQGFLNSVVFTLFVFVLGMSLSRFLTHVPDHTPKKIIRYFLKRTGILYLVYAILALSALLTQENLATDSVIGALTFVAPPNFTEYLPFFIMLSIITPLLIPLMKYTQRSLTQTLLAGVVSYLSGLAILTLPVPEIFSGVKQLLSGEFTTLRFPLLFYLPVVFIGTWWQYSIDHKKNGEVRKNQPELFLLSTLVFALVTAMYVPWIRIPLIDPGIRWPPSIGFLVLGICFGGICVYVMPLIEKIRAVVSTLQYIGKEALDILTSHLLLLFFYKHFVTQSFADPIWVAGLTILLLAASILVTSLTITGSPFPIRAVFGRQGKFRKRYIAYAIVALGILVLTNVRSQTSPYGAFMPEEPFSYEIQLPEHAILRLVTRRVWHLRNHQNEYLELRFSVAHDGKIFALKPDSVQFAANGKPIEAIPENLPDGSVLIRKRVDEIVPGTYVITAEINTSNPKRSATPIIIHVSEPLYVAYTFDWEGWDAPDVALSEITKLSQENAPMPFTHFINPRTFMPDVLPPERKETLLNFLYKRRELGDELGLHIHMHHDLVTAAGVATQSAHWGLRSEEGYDVPGSHYNTEEFRAIVSYALNLADELALTPFRGYRAGGFFINTHQLNLLSSFGFTYDSSGRDKPLTGAFRSTPWSLSATEQPYFPSEENQNLSSATTSGILEIPINGLTTYDQTSAEMLTRLTQLYPGGALTSPRTAVFVTHPQFYGREFPKIPQIMSRLQSVSYHKDAGPALFVPMSTIESVWRTLPN